MEVPMAMGRPKAALVLSPERRAQLESMASSRSLPAGPKRGYHLSFLPGVCQHVFVLCCRLRVSREAHRMQLEPFGEGPRPRGVRPSVSSWRAAAEHSPLSDTRARG